MPKSTFDSVGFQEFIDDHVQDLVKKMEWMKDTEMDLCESVAQLTDFINSIIAGGDGTKKPFCCLDLETTGLNTRVGKNGIPIEKIVGIALASSKNKGIYIPVNHKEGKECNLPEKDVLEEIKRLVRCVVIIVHNAKFDLQFLKNYGIIIDHYEDFEDTIILARLYDAGQKEIGLKHLSPTYIGRKMIELKEVTNSTNKLDLVHPKSCYVYAASDSVCTFGLFEFFINQPIIIEQMKVYCLEKRLLPVVMQMEANLVLIDKEYLSKEKIRIAEKLEGLKKEVQAIAKKDFNVGSTQQLGKVLFEELNYEYPEKKKTASGLYMTDTATLEKIADKYPMVKHIITIRKLEKTLGTYIENLLNNCDEEGFIKLGFSQNGTDTGRFSSPGGKGLHEDGYCGVNIQSIPANYDEHVPDVRKAFRARPGKKIVACDFSGEELRVAANLSKEKKWVDEFLYGSADLHTATGKTVFKKEEISKAERQLAKTLNFQILYGSGPRGIADQAKISEMEARRAVEGFLTGLPQLADWIKTERKKARKFKKSKTPFGRIRPFHMFYDSGDKGMEAHADRAAVNFMVQGCLKGSEKVLTNKGYLPIIEVKKLQESGEILKVWTGTSWETFDVIDRGPWQLATLELHNGMTLECDTRHQVLVRDGNTYDFKHFLNLKKGDLVCTTFPQEIIYGNDNVSPDSYSDDLLKASLEIRQKFLKNLNFNEYYSEEQLKNIQLIAWSSGIPLHLNNDGLKLEETESISEYFLSPIKNLYKIDQVENTYTLSVHSPLHRFDSAGIISKNSCADIMKIVMVRISNWIKSNNLEDEIKMLITMHDEIVFEMPENKLEEYIPQINDLMGLKDVLQDNLGWSVPLTIDAEYGDSWHVDHDFFKEHPELKNAKANIQFHSNTQVVEKTISTQETHTSDSTPATSIAELNPPIVPEDFPLLIPDSSNSIPDSTSQTITLETVVQTEVGEEEIFYRLKELSKINLLRLNQIITFLTEDCEKLFYKGPKAILRIQDKDGNILSVSNIKIRVDSFYSLARFFGL